MTETRIFLSYAVGDREFAHGLRDLIAKQGLKVEEPFTVAPAGSVWADEIAAQIRQSDALLLVVPPAGGAGANNAFFEAGAARALGKRVVAVVPERSSAHVRELPTDVSSFIVTDASREPIEQVANALVGALRAAA